MHGAAPAEALWRSLGNEREHVGGFRARQQKQGTRGLCYGPRWHCASHGGLGAFRQMARDRHELAHAARTEPLLQAIDQRRTSLRIMAIGRRSKVGLCRRDRLDNSGGKPERLEAETELDCLGNAFELEI